MLLASCKVLISWIRVKLLTFNLLRPYAAWILEHARGYHYNSTMKERLRMVLNVFFFFFLDKKKDKSRNNNTISNNRHFESYNRESLWRIYGWYKITHSRMLKIDLSKLICLIGIHIKYTWMPKLSRVL